MSLRIDDPGVGDGYRRKSRRIINQDGSFNIVRRGQGLNVYNAYQYLIEMGWLPFLGLVAAAFTIVNALFAVGYWLLGADVLQGGSSVATIGPFWRSFFFSVQTFTTVGYGTISPVGWGANLLSSFESLCGWLGFALATGLLYGRFSRPQARLRFSKHLLIAPYEDSWSLQFRLANRRDNLLTDVSAQVIFSRLDARASEAQGKHVRSFFNLTLERNRIEMFPLNWTVVHPIDDDSPLADMTEEDFREADAELIVLVRCFDDTYSQELRARYSYAAPDLVWGAQFVRAFHVEDSGHTVFNLDRLDDFEPVEEKAPPPEADRS